MPDNAPTTNQFWLLTGDVPSGPFTIPEIHAKLANGEATWQTSACPISGGKWLPLVQLPGFGPGGATTDVVERSTIPPPAVSPPQPVSVAAQPPTQYWLLAGNDATPVTVAEIQAKLRAGELPLNAKARPVGGVGWVPVSEVPGISVGESAPKTKPRPGGDSVPAAKSPTIAAATGDVTALVLIPIICLVIVLLLGGEFGQLGVGLVLVVFSLRGLFASRERIRKHSKWIGTNNPFVARLVCVIGFLLGVLWVGAPIDRFMERGATAKLTRPTAEQLVREKLEQRTQQKVDSIQLRDDPKGGFVGEARLGATIWDVKVTLRGGDVSWEAEPRAVKLDPIAPEVEEKVSAFVKRLGRKFSRDDQQPNKPIVEVDLIGTKVTDAELKEITPLTNLRILDLGGTAITDAGLKELTPLKHLVALDLNSTKITNSGMKELAAYLSMAGLGLANTKVTDEGVKQIAMLKNLTILDLRGTKVTDSAMKDLAALMNLSEVDLTATKVTDVGLKELVVLRKLTSLKLSGTEVTDEGVEELRKALPNCKIEK